MRHVSRTHRVALDWLLERISLNPKSKSSTLTPKTNLPLTKGNFTCDEWNHLLCLFNIGHFSSTVCSEVMSKRTQEESGEERVTAKSRPMMSLIARAPSTLSSSASESLGKRSYESQSPCSAKAEEYDRTVTQVTRQGTTTKDPLKARTQHATQDGTMTKAWSSQEWKADELMDDRTGTPVVCPQRGARTQQFIIGDDETELDFLLGSRSFLDRVNDQVRKRQKRSSMNVTEDGEKHSVIW